MSFDGRTLWGRDDETDEYTDSGAYGESLEENLRRKKKRKKNPE